MAGAWFSGTLYCAWLLASYQPPQTARAASKAAFERRRNCWRGKSLRASAFKLRAASNVMSAKAGARSDSGIVARVRGVGLQRRFGRERRRYLSRGISGNQETALQLPTFVVYFICYILLYVVVRFIYLYTFCYVTLDV